MDTLSLFMSNLVSHHLSVLPSPIRELLTLTNALVFLAAFELLYLVLVKFLIHPSMQVLSTPPSYPSSSNLAFIMRILHRLEKVYPGETTRPEMESFLRGWCLGAEFSTIQRENVVEFLAWATHAKTVESLSAAELSDVDVIMDHLSTFHKMDFPAGKNPNISTARLSLEPFSFIHRPLLLYIGIKLLSYVLKVTLLVCGFSRHRSSTGVRYWYRPPSSSSPSSAMPLIFFHGIAPCGCLFYLPMLFGTLLTAGRGALLFDTPAVTMLSHALSRAPSESDVVSAVLEATSRHFRPHSKFVLSGHSLGSCPVTWVVRGIPSVVGLVLLLDPVTLFLSHPDVAFNFVYKRTFVTVMERVIYYGASSEAFISHYLRRSFWWYRNELFVEDVPAGVPVIVALSMKDEIVNSKLVADGLECLKRAGGGRGRQQLLRQQQQQQQQQLRIIKLDEHSHAEMIHKPTTWNLIKEAIREEEAAAAKKKKVL